MNRSLYNLLLLLLTPLLPLRLLWRSIKAPAYRHRIGERFGLVPSNIVTGSTWVHAVSVGETVASEPLIKALLAKYPDRKVLITTMTPTGSAQVARSFSADLGVRVQHCYAPYDIAWCIKAFLQKTQPSLTIIMETELWPNTLHYCRQRQIPTLLANARLSASSAKGYAKLPGLVGPMLKNLDVIAVQHKDDGQRFVELGFPQKNLHVSGSVKFDYEIDAVLRDKAARLSNEWACSERPVWIAASTHRGEDEIVIAAHKQILKSKPDALLLLVPRHPERFDEVYKLALSHGLAVSRRSQHDSNQASSLHDSQLMLGDTMGELVAFFGISQQAFVGGSLVESGGHNPIEPAAWSRPVFMGPHVFNFSAISVMLVNAGGMRLIANAQMLAQMLLDNWDDKNLMTAQGAKALAVVQKNRGALDKHLALIASLS